MGIKRNIITDFSSGTPSSTYSVATGYSVGSEWVNTDNGNRFYHKTDGNWVPLNAETIFYIQGGTSSAVDTTSNIYRTGSLNIGSGTATGGRFVVSSSTGSVSLVVTETGNVGIGTASPSTKLHIVATQSGAFRLEDTTQGPGKVLISDADGVGSWTTGSFVRLTGNDYIQGEKTFGGNSNKIVIASGNYQGVFAGVGGGESGTNFYSQNQGTGTGAYFDTFNTGKAVQITGGASSSGRVLDIAAGGSGDAVSISSSGTGRLIVGMSGSNTNFTLNKAGEIYSTKIGIGLTGPSTKLHIYATQSGAFRLEDGTQSYPGYVLTSDANGVGTWQGNTQITLSGSTATALASWNNTTIMCNFSATCSVTIPDTGLPPNFSFRFIVISGNNSAVISFTYSSPVSILPNTLLTFAQYESGVIDRYGTSSNYYITY
jgi:hypothetical protein